ncbi:MAG: cobalamin biosynthesis protein [Alphaproteobacteria bacterium]|nr:cobalamin biosynthesis protein [Alphaproteobacteria bacterium]
MRVAGIGCRPGTAPAAIAAALAAAGGAEALATIPDRAPELSAAARALGLPLHLVTVAGIPTPTQSPRIRAAFGTGSVAEAAALALGGRLIAPRTIHGPVTIAIAEVP